MIWHIFKKDFRLHWRFAAAAAVLGWLTLIVAYRADHAGDTHQQMWNLSNLLLMLQILASGILAATVVQTDGIPGVRQDWLIRPIAHRDLLLAKLLFVLALIVGPVFLGALVEAVADRIPAGQAFIEALMGSLCLLGIFYLPIMAFAALTRNFAENIVAIVTAVAIVTSLVQIIGMLLPNWRMFDMTGIQWLAGFAMVGSAVFGAAVIIALQYLKRRTVTARWLAAAFGLLCVAANFIPWQPAFAIQQRFSQHPGGASAVNLGFQPSLGRYREPSRTYANGYSYMQREKGTTVYLPIHISGLAADTVLRIDMVEARLTGPDSKVQDLTPVVPPAVLNEGPIQDLSQARTTTHDLIFLPTAMYDKLRDTPVKLELDYSLTLLSLNSARGIPALDASESVPEFGHCETRLDKAGTEVQLRCMMIPRTPPCATVFLENVPSGRRNPEVILCRGQYTPFNLQFGPDTLRRAIVDLPFRDTAGLLHLPVDGSQLPQSQVVMRFYEAVEHFTRHEVITDVRLGDWLPM